MSNAYFQPMDDAVNELDEEAVNGFMARVFGWMFVGLLVTALTTLAIVMGINSSQAFADFIATAFQFIIIIVILQVVLVGSLSWRIYTMQPGTAKFLFLVYAMSNGLTVGLVSVLFAAEMGGWATLGVAFGITALSFGLMALYGFFTGRDLSGFMNLLYMALIGFILISLATWLFNVEMNFFILVAGLGIFLGLVAAKTNVIKNHYARVALANSGEYGSEEHAAQEALASNLAIIGALTLYLSFINIFMLILRIMGRRR
jgi:FtsH-binding integral membrane protein